MWYTRDVCTPVSAGEMLIDVEGNGNVMINIEMSVFIDVGVFLYNLFNTLWHNFLCTAFIPISDLCG